LGKLRIVEDRATLVYSLIDTSLSSLTGIGTWMNLNSLLTFFLNTPSRSSPLQRQNISTATFPSLLSLHQNSDSVTTSANNTIASSFVVMNDVPLRNGQTRSYDLNMAYEMYSTTIIVSIVVFVLILLVWVLFYFILRTRVVCLINRLTYFREKTRPKAMTSKVIVETTKKATTAAGKNRIHVASVVGLRQMAASLKIELQYQLFVTCRFGVVTLKFVVLTLHFFRSQSPALKQLRYELYQIEQFEQYMLADIKRKRKKSSLQLNTPEGLDYIRVARLHNVLRCCSITMIVFFLLYQGLVLAATSVLFGFIQTSYFPTATASIIAEFPLYFWTATGIMIFLFVVFITTWVFFKCWLPRATMFRKITIAQSLEESRALQFNVRETQRATTSSGSVRGRWYVTKYDRNILRNCGWLIGTVAKHSHWDQEDGVALGGTIVNQTLTQDEVTLKENEQNLFTNLSYMWPCYYIFFQMFTASIVTGLSHIDRTGCTQLIAMLLVYSIHLVACWVTWPKNIKRANTTLLSR